MPRRCDMLSTSGFMSPLLVLDFNNGGTPHEGREPDWWLDSQYQMSHEAFIEYVQSLPKPFTAWATKTKGPLDFTEEDES